MGTRTNISRHFKKIAAASALAMAFQVNAQSTNTPAEPSNIVGWSEFTSQAHKGNFYRVIIHTDRVVGYKADAAGTSIIETVSYGQAKDIAYTELKSSPAQIAFQTPPGAVPVKPMPVKEKTVLDKTLQMAKSAGSYVLDGFLNILPMILLMVGVLWYTARIMRKQTSSHNDDMKKSLEPVKPEDNKTRFVDVAGADEAKFEIQEVVDFLKNPDKYHKLGAKCPKGVLFVGPPGTGKTLLAKAVAGEADVPFYQISGSNFVEKFVGVGASRVRALFDAAKKHKSAIIFIDEVDAIGKARGNGFGGSNDEREGTLNQILVEMDGFNKDHNIIILAATNRPEILDSALIRPGRIDRQVTVGLADVDGREKILNVHAKGKTISSDVHLRDIARGTPGFSGADLANIMNEAAIFCARRDGSSISKVDFRDAIDKVKMGVAGKVSTDPDRKAMTAYHEAGHTIAALHEVDGPELHKVTIVPRGNSGGHASFMDKETGLQGTIGQMEAFIRLAVAGRVAERLIFGDNKVTYGAQMDIQMATSKARQMITQLGMSKELGMVQYDSSTTDPETAKLINTLVSNKIDAAEEYMTQVLTKNIDQLHLLANELIDRETLDADEVKALLTISKIPDPTLASPTFNPGLGVKRPVRQPAPMPG